MAVTLKVTQSYIETILTNSPVKLFKNSQDYLEVIRTTSVVSVTPAATNNRFYNVFMVQ